MSNNNSNAVSGMYGNISKNLREGAANRLGKAYRFGRNKGVPAVAAAASSAYQAAKTFKRNHVGPALYSCMRGVCGYARGVVRKTGLYKDLSPGLKGTPEDIQIMQGLVTRYHDPKEFENMKKEFHDDLGNLLETYVVDNEVESSVAAFRKMLEDQVIASKIKRLYMAHLGQMGREMEAPDVPTAIAMVMFIHMSDYDDMEYDNRGEDELDGLFKHLESSGPEEVFSKGGRRLKRSKQSRRSKSKTRRTRKNRK